jgi:hypothetical protein
MSETTTEVMTFRAEAADLRWNLREWQERAEYLIGAGIGTDAHADGIALAALIAENKTLRTELTNTRNKLIVAAVYAKREQQEFDAFDTLCEERDRWKAMYYQANDARIAATAIDACPCGRTDEHGPHED